MSPMPQCCICGEYFKPFTARFENCDLIGCNDRSYYGVDRWCLECIKIDKKEHLEDSHSSVDLV